MYLKNDMDRYLRRYPETQKGVYDIQEGIFKGIQKCIYEIYLKRRFKLLDTFLDGFLRYHSIKGI